MINNKREKKFVSLVVYLHNVQNDVVPFFEKVVPTLAEKFEQFEIVCVDDVHNVVQRYVREGKLKSAQWRDMEEKIVRLITMPQTSRWFAPDVHVITETDILKSGEKINRPDRVVIDGDIVTVIDYKFGQVERGDYKSKVSKSMQLVRDMGYRKVVGCVWYVEKDKFVAVE